MALAKKTNGSDKIAASLYERDFYSWALEQQRALLEHRIEDLDWDNLADEVGDLARSERRAFRSQCARLIEHLLKLAFAPPHLLGRNKRLWQVSVREAQREVNELLVESPGMSPSSQGVFSRAWFFGRDEALKNLKLPDTAIPETPLWTFNQAMDESLDPRK
jgi:hypothetical protein